METFVSMAAVGWLMGPLAVVSVALAARFFTLIFNLICAPEATFSRPRTLGAGAGS
ncbi:hypothetical protein HMPREF0742_01875 [Rothia aeria F0184]|uniref:Uncharacterized protein n=1 Tax=Rothia aeria F0184 TaxID=888019 RepID=U7V1N1_9MICC|nr:hypothetical protein HMPREF0742_01875 [Rothia aeria F0184]